MGGYDTDLTEKTITGAFEATIDAGVTLFDTAEGYGDGESERIIGRLLKADAARATAGRVRHQVPAAAAEDQGGPELRTSLLASLDRLGLEKVDLYQLHGPISLRSHGALADALAAVRQEGLVAAVGVSNYSAREMEKIHAALGRSGVPLASNQIEFSLLRRRPETGGLLAACKRLGVVPLAYSPIGQGRLTGKYSASNPPPGKRNFSDHPMEQVDPVVAELRRIGEAHDRTPSQVALRWLIEAGAVPIPGAKNADQAEQNAGALGWELSPEEVAALDSVALDGKRTLFGRIWQHG